MIRWSQFLLLRVQRAQLVDLLVATNGTSSASLLLALVVVQLLPLLLVLLVDNSLLFLYLEGPTISAHILYLELSSYFTHEYAK